MNQLSIFDQAPPPITWADRDIWTDAWNRAINLAIITECTGKWLKLADLREIAEIFQLNETDPPFHFQVVHLERNTRQLKVRSNTKTGVIEWTAK
jgi:hypothetical protein